MAFSRPMKANGGPRLLPSLVWPQPRGRPAAIQGAGKRKETAATTHFRDGGHKKGAHLLRPNPGAFD
eukprot:896150-Heterocapsa_arctica.AAC.1